LHSNKNQDYQYLSKLRSEALSPKSKLNQKTTPRGVILGRTRFLGVQGKFVESKMKINKQLGPWSSSSINICNLQIRGILRVICNEVNEEAICSGGFFFFFFFGGGGHH
jgi:hypothetical protein